MKTLLAALTLAFGMVLGASLTSPVQAAPLSAAVSGGIETPKAGAAEQVHYRRWRHRHYGYRHYGWGPRHYGYRHYGYRHYGYRHYRPGFSFYIGPRW